jgi:hypothetical protein
MLDWISRAFRQLKQLALLTIKSIESVGRLTEGQRATAGGPLTSKPAWKAP